MKFIIESLNKLPEAANTIIKHLKLKPEMQTNNCIAFYGEMGAGKTTLIKAICNEMGITDITSSPSFSLINEYLDPEGKSIFHFDFYRIDNIEEAFDIGYEDYFYSNSLCLIEWPEKIKTLLPGNHIMVNISTLNTDSRQVEILPKVIK
ncbi:MAG: tRNA (adenosine(37)-N6)-threonylcarbamoyltransferase complex ATPase subunit type 1 TsaE [Bacteroidetes bacterium 4572_117]|nr:MAG: tRNA (adenosine(37)-N6)-threonylcarbamoyltransferase complex ATPase subunit type 1 TsaE [Bacteroidetes bacterium 4572_117]